VYKKKMAVLIAAFFALAMGATAQARLYSLRFSVAPVGGYQYAVTGNSLAEYTGGFRQLSASLMYDIGRAFSWGTDFSAGAYFDFKGYLYETDGGYQSSSNGLVSVWGLPNFAIGICAGWKAMSIGAIDLMTLWGFEYTHYFQTETITSPGYGASIRAFFEFPLSEALMLSAGGFMSASRHPANPSNDYYPFNLFDFGPSIGLALGM
jgi:hypothetical protein